AAPVRVHRALKVERVMAKSSHPIAATLLSLAWLAGCSSDASGPAHTASPSLIESISPAGFPKGTSIERAPADNALTEERATLGKRLFYDPQLSRTNEISCGSCHQQAYAFDRECGMGQDLLLGRPRAHARTTSGPASRKPRRNGSLAVGSSRTRGWRSELRRSLSKSVR